MAHNPQGTPTNNDRVGTMQPDPYTDRQTFADKAAARDREVNEATKAAERKHESSMANIERQHNRANTSRRSRG